MTTPVIDAPAELETRLSSIGALAKGYHGDDHSAMCILEAVAVVAGEPWSDHPECVCPVIGAFMRNWNDCLPDNERDALLRPLIMRLIGTRGSADLERRRAIMAADWLIRVHTSAWLRLAKLNKQADLLTALPEITDFAQCPSLMPTLTAIRQDAAAARAAARVAARAAVWDAARVAAVDAVRAAVWDAARVAAVDAVRVAAVDALNNTRVELQRSALALVERMIAATSP